MVVRASRTSSTKSKKSVRTPTKTKRVKGHTRFGTGTVKLSEKEANELLLLLDRVHVQVIEREQDEILDFVRLVGARIDDLHRDLWTREEYAQSQEIIHTAINVEEITQVDKLVSEVARRMGKPEWLKNRAHPVWAMAKRLRETSK